MLHEALAAGAVAGALSSPHCATMCGPVCAAVCGNTAARVRSTRYQAGRILGYALLGSIAGQAGAVVRLGLSEPWAGQLLWLGAGAALALLAWRLWRRSSEPTQALVTLRVRQQPRGWVSRALRILPREPAALGALSALLPCGALAAALLLAAATGQRLEGAALMAGFAVSSGFAVLGGSLLLARATRIRHRRLGRALSITLLLLALVAFARPLIAEVPTTSATSTCH